MKKFLLVISVAAALSACASNASTVSKDAQLTQNWSNDQLYSEARQELNDGNYTRATALYELLRARQADGRYTEQSLIESAYAHFKNEEPAKALQNLARFEQNYPASVDMDYALYLKGLVLFAEDQSFLRRLASQDWSDRDPEANRRAFRVFEQLVNRYPNSKYAEDARKRMAQLVDALGRARNRDCALLCQTHGIFSRQQSRSTHFGAIPKHALCGRSVGDYGLYLRANG